MDENASADPVRGDSSLTDEATKVPNRDSYVGRCFRNGERRTVFRVVRPESAGLERRPARGEENDRCDKLDHVNSQAPEVSQDGASTRALSGLPLVLRGLRAKLAGMERQRKDMEGTAVVELHCGSCGARLYEVEWWKGTLALTDWPIARDERLRSTKGTRSAALRQAVAEGRATSGRTPTNRKLDGMDRALGVRGPRPQQAKYAYIGMPSAWDMFGPLRGAGQPPEGTPREGLHDARIWCRCGKRFRVEHDKLAERVERALASGHHAITLQ